MTRLSKNNKNIFHLYSHYNLKQRKSKWKMKSNRNKKVEKLIVREMKGRENVR